MPGRTDLVLTPHGEVVAVGWSAWTDTGNDLSVLTLRARNGRGRTAAPRRARPAQARR